MTYDETKQKARDLGIVVKGNPSQVALEEEIRLCEETLAIANKDAGKDAELIVDKPKVKKAMSRQEAMQMVKVRVTPLDEALKGLPSDLYAVANKNIGTVSQVVLFNKPTLVFKVILDSLKATQMAVSGGASGNGAVEFNLVPAYNIAELSLTEEELATLQGK